MSEDDIVRLTLLFSALAAVFGGLTVFKPLLKAIWRHWLRFWWYRAMVALREDRSHYRVLDLPEGFKGILRWVLHPVRRWHPKNPTYENRIRKFAVCPFYHPSRCVRASGYGELNLGCYPDTCHSLGVGLNSVPDARQQRLLRIVRERPSSKRAIRFARTDRPCDTPHCLRVLKVRGEPLPTPFNPQMKFNMGDDRWLCATCFGVPFELLDLLPRTG